MQWQYNCDYDGDLWQIYWDDDFAKGIEKGHYSSRHTDVFAKKQPLIYEFRTAASGLSIDALHKKHSFRLFFQSFWNGTKHTIKKCFGFHDRDLCKNSFLFLIFVVFFLPLFCH